MKNVSAKIKYWYQRGRRILIKTLTDEEMDRNKQKRKKNNDIKRHEIENKAKENLETKNKHKYRALKYETTSANKYKHLH